MAKTKVHLKHFMQPPTTELSMFLAGDNQLVICNGVNPSYKKGILSKDLGFTQKGLVLNANKSITGLHHSRRTPAVQEMLATVNNSAGTNLELYYYTLATDTWTEITDAETAWAGYEDCLVEMEDFIGYTFFVGYDSTDGVWLPVRTLTTSSHTFGTTLTTDMPNAKYITRYRDKIFLANCYASATAYPYRVYYSSVPSAGAITWTPASDFLDVDYSEQITGIAQNWDRLVIFTDSSAYMYDEESYKKVWETGCAQHRTIKNIEGYMIWANKDNVWASTGGKPTPLGNDILELIRASTPSNWRAEIIDGEYCLYLGNTSANGIAYTNCLATYNIDTGMWRWREYLKSVITALAKYQTTTGNFLWLGQADGEIAQKSKWTDTTPVYSDDGTAIISHWRTKAYDMGDPSVIKEISKIKAYSEKGNGLNLQYRLIDKGHESIQEFQPIGMLKGVITEFNETISGYFIQFEGKEYGTRQAWKFYGLSFLVEQDTEFV